MTFLWLTTSWRQSLGKNGNLFAQMTTKAMQSHVSYIRYCEATPSVSVQFIGSIWFAYHFQKIV